MGRLIVLDVSEEMLRRTRERCSEAGLRNVEFVHGNGLDFQPVPDDSVDFFFSYDVFVHIALEDTWAYAHEMARVLKPGGVGACHHAIHSIPEAWDRIEEMNDWYRKGSHTLGQYYYYSPESLRRMYERCGLRVLEGHQSWVHFTQIFRKPEVDVVPRLERLLGELMGEPGSEPGRRRALVGELRGLTGRLEAALEPWLERIGGEEDHARRAACVRAIRDIWRGL